MHIVTLLKIPFLSKLIKLVFYSKVGIATTFSAANDPWNPVAFLACYRRDMTDKDMVVAHPTLPCKSKVLIYNIRTKLWTVARIGDRGPRKALVDLNLPVAKAIKSNGFDKVILASF